MPIQTSWLKSEKFIFALAGMLLFFTAWPSAASNEPDASFTCSGTGTQTYDPGLLLLARPTVINNTATFNQCIGSPVKSGQFSFGPFQTIADCLLSSPSGNDEIDYVWDDGSTSHFSGTFVVTRPLGQLIVSSAGTFTSGRFEGHAVQSVITYVAPNPLACLADPGVTALSGPITVTVLPIL
ncbi:hypothetical protein KDD30_08950 [Photobacterium sp. GJ3]|uniref:hypothetical protein n=1 Tax=Photobacterium sp. GJ3 TaxID=2829502 RepID=UPI001B8D8C65|nr:hypothetical protein [Photobacterium sp. GJ3]QUJ66314.1 hypothetical protein KDD30_08950 [Photobacterium sp. GJ3]